MTLEHIDRFSWIFWNYHFKSKENIDIHYCSRIFEVRKLPRTIIISSLIQNVHKSLFVILEVQVKVTSQFASLTKNSSAS